MTLKIRGVREKGLLEKERVVLDADASEDIGQYILASTTYVDDGTVSSSLRKSIWLPDYKVDAGDLVVIYTKKSAKRIKTKTNEDGTKTTFIYWGLDEAIWNRGEDSVVLIKIDTWTSKNL